MPLFDRQKKHVQRAVSLRRAGDATGAIDVLAEVLTVEPDHVPANVEMARALRMIGDPAEAEDYLKRAIEEVLDYQLVVELAQVVAEQGRGEDAHALVDAALEMANGNPRFDPGEALLVRAAIHHAQGLDEDARAALDQIPAKRSGKEVKEFAERLRARLG
jgi:hypothetical protein